MPELFAAALFAVGMFGVSVALAMPRLRLELSEAVVTALALMDGVCLVGIMYMLLLAAHLPKAIYPAEPAELAAVYGGKSAILIPAAGVIGVIVVLAMPRFSKDVQGIWRWAFIAFMVVCAAGTAYLMYNNL